MAVAYYGRDAVERCQFGWRALCIAAGDDDSGRWIEAMGAADKSAGLAVGFGGHGAGVYDDHIGL